MVIRNNGYLTKPLNLTKLFTNKKLNIKIGQN